MASTNQDLDKVSEPQFTLVSMEQDTFTITRKQAQSSELLRTLLENDTTTTVPLPHIRTSSLDRCVRYLKHHGPENPPAEIEKPLRTIVLSEIVEVFDSDLVELSPDQLFELLVAASYLHIKPLVELVSAKIAISFKNKNPAQLRKSLNIVNDLTPAEEEAIKQEYRLLEDK